MRYWSRCMLPARVAICGRNRQMMPTAKPEDTPMSCRVLRGSSSRDEIQLNSTVAYSTNGVGLYPTASLGADDTFDTRQRSDHSALNSIQTFPEHRGSSKEFYRQVSKLRRTHHHGFNINKSLAQHRKNGSVIFSTSDSSGSSIRTLQNFRERTRLKQWPSVSCDHKHFKRH